jgi:hypothetical protein
MSTNFWDARRGIIRTSKGGRWIIGKGVTSHGYSLLDDLVGHAGFFQVLIMHVTGRLPERRLADWFEAAFLCLSWPDPRMWPNCIGALGGSARTSPIAAVCLGTLASDSGIYGPGTAIPAANFIVSALNKKKAGYTVEQIITDKSQAHAGELKAPGYIRPFAKGDERVEHMQRVSDALGFPIGPHLTLAYEIQDYLFEEYGESMNLAGYMVAFLSDHGLSSNDIYRVCSLCVTAGVHACYAEAADRPPESFLPLRCDDIEYTGKQEREIPTTGH